jgi:two-component system NarL family sensor kinase
MPQPVLAEMLFTALNEHEAALSRVARLLHDDVSQVLSAVGLQLDAMRMDFRDGAPGFEDRTAEIQTMLEQAIGQLRDISNELNPSIVERAGLQFALDRLVGNTRKTFTGTLHMHFDPATRMPTALAKTFYKIAECALEIAVTQPECSVVDIHVKRSQGEFVLKVNDNGKSDNDANDSPSLGRLLMGYHASRNKVTLSIKNSSQAGTMIRATYPISESAV